MKLFLIRYLATGDCLTSISYQYLVGFSTTTNIITETCQVIWNCLCKEVLPYPLETTDWLKISKEFDEQWQFPHCIGAVDGKHIQIQVYNLIYFNSMLNLKIEFKFIKIKKCHQTFYYSALTMLVHHIIITRIIIALF